MIYSLDTAPGGVSVKFSIIRRVSRGCRVSMLMWTRYKAGNLFKSWVPISFSNMTLSMEAELQKTWDAFRLLLSAIWILSLITIHGLVHKVILLYLIGVFLMLLEANKRRARLANYRRWHTNHSFLPLSAETMGQKVCIILIQIVHSKVTFIFVKATV
jgi:hypothetical protein